MYKHMTKVRPNYLFIYSIWVLRTVIKELKIALPKISVHQLLLRAICFWITFLISCSKTQNSEKISFMSVCYTGLHRKVLLIFVGWTLRLAETCLLMAVAGKMGQVGDIVTPTWWWQNNKRNQMLLWKHFKLHCVTYP